MRAAALAVVAAVLWGGARVGRVWWRNRRRLWQIDGALRRVRMAEGSGVLGRETAAVLEAELLALRRHCPGGGVGR